MVSQSSPKLDSRRGQILISLVREYIRQATPIPSETIQARLTERVSSATVRNDLAALEDEGYLLQPHHSAGRIPSDSAYRFYVDHLMGNLEYDIRLGEETRRIYERVERELWVLLQLTLNILTNRTGYLSFISVPSFQQFKISELKVIQTSRSSILLVLITTNGYVFEKLVDLCNSCDRLNIRNLEESLNRYLSNRSILGVDLEEVRRIIYEVMEEPQTLLKDLLDFLRATHSDDLKVRTRGEENLLREPEFDTAEDAKPVITAVQDERAFSRLLAEPSEKQVLRVIIGSENRVPALRGCSVVMSSYFIKDYPTGTIGVLGPTRLAYKECVESVRLVADVVSSVLTESPFRIGPLQSQYGSPQNPKTSGGPTGGFSS